MVPENAYSILREDFKLYNDQFIQITKISPCHIQPKQFNSKERNRSATIQQNRDNNNIINNNQIYGQKLNEIVPQSQGIDIISKHLKQLEAMQEQNNLDQSYFINVNNDKMISQEVDKKYKFYHNHNDKSPLNKQMLISRFIQRNQKELDQTYEKNIEDDLRKPIGLRTFNSDQDGGMIIDKNNQFQINNQNENKSIKQNQSFQNTITNFKKNRTNICKELNLSANPIIHNNNNNSSFNYGNQLGESNNFTKGNNQSMTKKQEEINNTNTINNNNIMNAPNTIYTQNVYNRIILKQTERKKIKLQSIGYISENQISQTNDNNSSSQLQLVNQSAHQSDSTHYQSFYNPTDNNTTNNINSNKKQHSHKLLSPNKKNPFHNNRSDSCNNHNQTISNNFYKVEQPSLSCSPNKQTPYKIRPQTQQNHRRRIMSSHQQNSISNHKNQQENFNGANSLVNITQRAISPAQRLRQYLNQQSGNTQQINSSFISKEKDLSNQNATLFQISSYNLKNNNNNNDINNTNQENENTTIKKHNQFELLNLNRKRQGILKQMNDYKQKVNRDKETKQNEMKLKLNTSMKAKELVIEAVGLTNIKQNLINPISNQINNINNNQEFFHQFSTSINEGKNHIKNVFDNNDTNNQLFTMNDSNNMSIHLITDQQNCDSIQKIKNSIHYKTLNSLESNPNNTIIRQQQQKILPNSIIQEKQDSDNNILNDSFTQRNKRIKEDEYKRNLANNNSNNNSLQNKNKKNGKRSMSKYDLIKKQIENENKRKQMQQQITQQEIETNRKIKQDLYLNFLNQQGGFSLYFHNNKDLSSSPPQNISDSNINDINHQNRFNLQDSPNIKQLVKYYDNKYGDKFQQSINSQPNHNNSNNNNAESHIFQNQTFGLYDQDDQINNINNNQTNLSHPIQQNKQKKKINLPQDRNIEMGPWTSQNEYEQEEQFPKNI